MESLLASYKQSKQLHHAYVIEGNADKIRRALFDFIQHELKHDIQGNPDFWHRQTDSLSIDDARELRDIQSNKAFGTGRKIFVVEMIGMSVEAQNALLKVFEEPTPLTHFFLIMPSSEILLPTLRSRVAVISDQEKKEGSAEAKKFVSLSPAARLKAVSEIIEEKDKAKAISLVTNLILHFSAKPMEYSAALNNLLKARSYLNDRSASLKLILEHISLTI
jgi:DNA polymerase III delta prime subunit